MTQAVWILFLPLLSFVLSPFIPERKRRLAGWIAFLSMAAGFILSVRLALPVFQGAHPAGVKEFSVAWISVPPLAIETGILLDSLSIVMSLIVTGVGSAIFYYSLEYMAHDEGFRRYFAGLSIFAFSMLGIVFSNNLLQLFIFWELVGLSSYLLIGHWYEKPEAADAGKKAFLTNRVGDFGFLIGILLLWVFSGSGGSEPSLNINALGSRIPSLIESGGLTQTMLSGAMLLVFLGVMGKSAQFPLHVWLPDAMEGPTPVSALIHAATMVAAGVYLTARMFALFARAPEALEIISYVGALTAILAATQALVQIDIKRILAYSTLSQLGLMVMALGLGSSSAAMYHLTTHAFFKALLFLAAGSIIHAAHTQDIRQMGGLVKKLPLSSTAFLIGSYALIGLWPASGFFSKDEILSLALAKNGFLFWTAVSGVFLTALYTGRVVSIALLGNSNLKKKPHEPGRQMLLPLAVLAFLSLTAGFFGFEKMLHSPLDFTFHTTPFAVQVSTAAALAGLIIALIYHRAQKALGRIFESPFSWITAVLERKYFMDDFYDFLISKVQAPFSVSLDSFERGWIVRGLVNGTARACFAAGGILRNLQTGLLRTYLSLFSLGVILALYFFVIRGALQS